VDGFDEAFGVGVDEHGVGFVVGQSWEAIRGGKAGAKARFRGGFGQGAKAPF
jgi:hypothetical protein